MTQATSTKPRSRIIRRDRTIIERPRLIKKLDECDARTILLLAPAGYGKTTLAHQWANTLSRVIWVSLTSAHRDVTVLARDLARSIEELGEDGFVDFMDQYLKARQNPQKEAREIGLVLADALQRIRLPWLVLDDYHELVGVPDAELLLKLLRDISSTRILICTRLRPTWVTHRECLYGDAIELRQEDLLMDDAESLAVVGRGGPRIHRLLSMAHGWPAAIGLAAKLDLTHLPTASLPEALHGFLAEELFASLSGQVKTRLTELALRPSRRIDDLIRRDDRSLPSLEIETIVDAQSGLHPLLRDFLLSKLTSEPQGLDRVRETVRECLDDEEWTTAFDLIERFSLHEMVDEAIRASYRPLLRNGQIWTLAEFVASTTVADNATNSGAVSLVLAQSANAEGHFLLTRQLAERAYRQLSKDDTLRPAAGLLLGQSTLLFGDHLGARAIYEEARQHAADDKELGEAIFSLVNESVNWESDDAREDLELLRARRDNSKLDLVRYGTSITNAKRLSPEGYDDDGIISECLHALPHVSDPRVSTSARWTFAYTYLLQARYAESTALLADVSHEVEIFRLSFILPYLHWLRSAIALSARDFGGCDRYLDHAERSIEGRYVLFHDLNIRSLRARLYLQTGRVEEAWECLGLLPDEDTLPSMRGEYLATRALVAAIRGDSNAATRIVADARSTSAALEVTSYAGLAEALLRFRAGDFEGLVAPFRHAHETRAWDPLITLLRSAPDFAEATARWEPTQHMLRDFCERIDDRPLARQTKLRIRTSITATDNRLSQRENEVLGLISQGFKNSDIAKALFISESTVKVHVRHIFEKLGVKTRAEATARFSSL